MTPAAQRSAASPGLLSGRENYFRRLVENAHELFLVLDTAGRIIYRSPSAEKLPIRDEPSAAFFSELIHPDDLEAFESLFALLLLHPGRTVQAELRLGDGRGPWLHCQGAANNLLEDPLVGGIVVNLRDVTDCRTIARRLEHSEQRYQELVESMGQGLVRMDREARLLFVNRAVERITGQSRGELLERPLTELLEGRERRRFERQWARRRQGEDGCYELSLLDRAGRRVWVQIDSRAVLDEEGEFLGTVAVITDITARRRAERRLRRQDARLRAVVDGIRDGIVLVNRRMEVLLANRAALDDAGRERLEGRPSCHELFCLQPGPPGDCLVRETLRTGRGGRRQVERRDGRIIDLRSEPVLSRGHPVGAVVIGEDVTERADWERALRFQLLQTERLAAAGKLAAEVAHEINNPLGAIKNSLYLLGRAIPPGHPDRRYLELIEREVARAAELTSRLYDLHRPSAQRVERVDPAAVAADVLKLLEARVRRQGIVLNPPAGGSPPILVRASVSQLTQVLYNILLNAVQAMPSGGVLSLRAEAGPDRCRLTVGDTGPGIDPQVLPRIFEPFFTTKDRPENSGESTGMGLGLALARSVMESLGGGIAVESRPGRGATFILTFPPAEGEGAPGPGERRAMRILPGEIDSARPYLRPVFFNRLPVEQLRELIGADPLFRAEGFQRSTNYQRL